jgi:hypothetical protein
VAGIWALISIEVVVAVRPERVVGMVEGVRLLKSVSGWSHLMQRLGCCLKKRSTVVRVVVDLLEKPSGKNHLYN